jgi:hypothetical protein
MTNKARAARCRELAAQTDHAHEQAAWAAAGVAWETLDRRVSNPSAHAVRMDGLYRMRLTLARAPAPSLLSPPNSAVAKAPVAVAAPIMATVAIEF